MNLLGLVKISSKTDILNVIIKLIFIEKEKYYSELTFHYWFKKFVEKNENNG